MLKHLSCFVKTKLEWQFVYLGTCFANYCYVVYCIILHFTIKNVSVVCDYAKLRLKCSYWTLVVLKRRLYLLNWPILWYQEVVLISFIFRTRTLPKSSVTCLNSVSRNYRCLEPQTQVTVNTDLL